MDRLKHITRAINASTPDFISFSVSTNGGAFILLKRPRAINALNFSMLETLLAVMKQLQSDPLVSFIVITGDGEKGFCAGGDILELAFAPDDNFSHSFVSVEYELDYLITTSSKPVVVFMHGICMGGGVGLGMGSAYPIVSNSTSMAMPEAGIGFFTDVGSSWFMSRLPGGLGPFIALTGYRLDAWDLHYCGLSSWYCEDSRRENVLERLRVVNPEDLFEFLRGFQTFPENSSKLFKLRQEIDELFAYDSVAEIITRLKLSRSKFALETLSTILQKSPTGLLLSFEGLERARSLSKLDVFRNDLRVASRLTPNVVDFKRGVTVVCIEKKGFAKWCPSSVDSISPEYVTSFFEPFTKAELAKGWKELLS